MFQIQNIKTENRFYSFVKSLSREPKKKFRQAYDEAPILYERCYDENNEPKDVTLWPTTDK